MRVFSLERCVTEGDAPPHKVEKHVVAAETLVKSKGADEESPLQSMAFVVLTSRGCLSPVLSVPPVVNRIRALSPLPKPISIHAFLPSES